jgi:hypothetical protein
MGMARRRAVPLSQKELAFLSKESVCVGVARLKTLRGKAYAPTIEVDPGLASVRGLDWPGPHRHERLDHVHQAYR